MCVGDGSAGLSPRAAARHTHGKDALRDGQRDGVSQAFVVELGHGGVTGGQRVAVDPGEEVADPLHAAVDGVAEQAVAVVDARPHVGAGGELEAAGLPLAHLGAGEVGRHDAVELTTDSGDEWVGRCVRFVEVTMADAAGTSFDLVVFKSYDTSPYPRVVGAPDVIATGPVATKLRAEPIDVVVGPVRLSPMYAPTQGDPHRIVREASTFVRPVLAAHGLT